MNEVADPKQQEILDKQEAVQKLAAMFETSGWSEIVFPALLNIRNNYNVGLINGEYKDENGKLLSDTEIRSVIKVCDWMLSWPNRKEAVVKELVFAAAQNKE